MTPFQKLKRWIYVKSTPLRHKYLSWKLDLKNKEGEMPASLKKPLKILKFPHYILQRKASPVKEFDKKLLKLIIRMMSTQATPPWGKAAGIAAPQIGRSIQLFVSAPDVFINPTIVKSGLERDCKEGCFSLEKNKFDYPIRRAQSVWIKYQDELGKHREQKFNGFKAEVIQHEYDHLQGHCLTSSQIKITTGQKILFVFQAIKYWFLEIFR